MYSVVFEYPVEDKMLKVVAECREIVNEEVYGLSLTFYDVEDNIVKIAFDQDAFDDLEGEALVMLADLYYNRELNFATH